MSVDGHGRGAVRDQFVDGLGFLLDDFQVRALDALDGGRSVLVAAPTGSGKTVVAEYAMAVALAEGRKAFYTTPLKALSNQKFGDLVRAHGADKVGLLTGDNAVNGDAPLVVMTTEVLRNMIYAGSPTLRDLRYVVLDEVHYLQNQYRGAVWEEVIIHTPPEVDLVCLSATVSNAEEFADWIGTVRGDTEAVISERRPVELEHLYFVGDRTSQRLHLMPTFVDGRPNPEVDALEKRDAPPKGHGPHVRHRSKLVTPRRAEVIHALGDADMLPAIYFIFSRAACDDAVQQCVRAGLHLTTPEERSEIRSIAEARLAGLDEDDLRILGHDTWLSGLMSGFAAHHAGMVPPFKEVVEACFARALVKAVFATETLSLGINMPARSVVIEKLTKFTGERHEFLTPGEYTQLTGRAGRRGIDDHGFAVVLWSPFVPFEQVAGLASKRTFALTSSFRPTYNMAANLVRRYEPGTAHRLLNLSFAQYCADAEVVRIESHLEKARRTLDEVLLQATCERGDVVEYHALVQQGRDQTPSGDPARVTDAMARLRPGDVVVLETGKSAGRAAVISTAARRGGDVRLKVVTPSRRVIQVGPHDFRGPPHALARVALPTPFAPSSPRFVRAVADSLGRAKLADAGHGSNRKARRAAAAIEAREGGPGRAADHPVAGCPDAPVHLRAADRAARLTTETERLNSQIFGRTESLARQFDRVLQLLEAWGYVDGWALTEDGERLARTYHEADLLVAETVRSGLFDGLSAPEVAAVASFFTFEARGADQPSTPHLPGTNVRNRWESVELLAQELRLAEKEAGLPLTRPPQAGFAALAHAWASGGDLDDTLVGEDLSGGDFVRNIKQLLDLLRQLAGAAGAAGEDSTRNACKEAADAMFRGVVAASSMLGV